MGRMWAPPFVAISAVPVAGTAGRGGEHEPSGSLGRARK
jgi:hypothetical protein